jgi:heptose II phosphotransferase
MSFFLKGPWHLVSNLDEATSCELLDAVVGGQVRREQVFRDNWRTLSARVRFRDDELLLKVPRARNTRRWERLLTLFRGSDAVRSFWHLEHMAAMGFSAPEPVLAGEKWKSGVVTDSFVCYRYVDGRPAGPDEAPMVLDALRALHRKGYLRTDAQIANFLICGDAVVFIDFRLKKPRFLPALQKARELDRLIRSCPEAKTALTQDEALSWWLRVASWLENLNFGIRRLKRRFSDKRKKRNP